MQTIPEQGFCPERWLNDQTGLQQDPVDPWPEPALPAGKPVPVSP
jgi:hypothetical protein